MKDDDKKKKIVGVLALFIIKCKVITQVNNKTLQWGLSAYSWTHKIRLKRTNNIVYV